MNQKNHHTAVLLCVDTFDARRWQSENPGIWLDGFVPIGKLEYLDGYNSPAMYRTGLTEFHPRLAEALDACRAMVLRAGGDVEAVL